jgi:hypothetical protein
MRVDQVVGRIQLDAGNRMHAVFARVGGQQYADGVTLRPPDELFAPKTIASLIAAPVTLGHGGPCVGRIVEAAPQGGTHLVGTIEIDEQHLSAVRNAPPFLSGEWRGRYDPPDPKLADIFGGHHAVARDLTFTKMAVGVAAPRCGNACVRSDRIDCETCTGMCAITDPKQEETTFMSNATNSDEITELKKQLDTERARADAAEGRAAALATQQTVTDADLRANYNADVKERVHLEVTAHELGLHVDAIKEASSNAGLRKAMLAKISPKIDTNGKSEVWIKNALDAFLEAGGDRYSAMHAVRAMGSGFAVRDGAPNPFEASTDPEIARQRMIRRSQLMQAGGNADAATGVPAPRQYRDAHEEGEAARQRMIQRSRDLDAGHTGERTSPAAQKIRGAK